MNADEGVTAAVMVKWYCLKAGLDPSSAEKLRLQIDGELVRPETAVRDMEVEDKDQVDIL